MATFLFDKTVFGPVISRRLGISLGINLLPNDSKLCSFDCIYCECGWNPDPRKVKANLPAREDVSKALKIRLQQMSKEGQLPDVITFAGNGEPTMHPAFARIIDDTIALRDQLAPQARIAVLSNATMLFKDSVKHALLKVDDNIQKLDSAFTETISIMNLPVKHMELDSIIEQLRWFQGRVIIQTMFLKGSYNKQDFDNTSEKEVAAWIDLLKVIKPERIMIYTIARDTPLQTLEKIESDRLQEIARQVEAETSIKVEVSA